MANKDQDEYIRATHKQKLKGREKYGPLIVCIVTGWLLVLIAILVLQGFGYRSFSLSDVVLTALISGVSVNVVGLFYIVIKFLFSE